MIGTPPSIPSCLGIARSAGSSISSSVASLLGVWVLTDTHHMMGACWMQCRSNHLPELPNLLVEAGLFQYSVWKSGMFDTVDGRNFGAVDRLQDFWGSKILFDIWRFPEMEVSP